MTKTHGNSDTLSKGHIPMKGHMMSSKKNYKSSFRVIDRIDTSTRHGDSKLQ